MGRGLSAESRQLIERAYDVLAVEYPSGVCRVAYALFGNRAAWPFPFDPRNAFLDKDEA